MTKVIKSNLDLIIENTVISIEEKLAKDSNYRFSFIDSKIIDALEKKGYHVEKVNDSLFEKYVVNA